MKIYNQDLSRILSNEEADESKGKLITSSLLVNVEKDGQIVQETEEIYIYIPFSDEEIKERLRFERQMQCFEIINRGEIFWDYLWNKYSQEEIVIKKQELMNWYHSWLDVTDTKVIPTKPEWLN